MFTSFLSFCFLDWAFLKRPDLYIWLSFTRSFARPVFFVEAQLLELTVFALHGCPAASFPLLFPSPQKSIRYGGCNVNQLHQ